MPHTVSMSINNRTGLQRSPIDAKQLIAGEENFTPRGTPQEFAAYHGQFIAEAEPLGSVPVPGTLKGAAKSGMTMIKGKRPQVLIDKLGERLAFERGGTRLYEALLVKCQALPPQPGLDAVTPERVRQIRDDEAGHVELVIDAIDKLGGDPTAQTPCADLVGVESMGLVQVLSDPRTSLAQCLHALLTAELTDNASWELLIKLADGCGQTELSQHFRTALQREQVHLQQIRQWHEQAAMEELKI